MPVLRTFLLTVFFLFLAAIIALLVFREDISAYLGAGPEHKIPIPSGNIDVPRVRMYPSSDQSVLKRGILEYWADQPFPEWAEKHKVTGPRVVLGCLMSGTRIEEANAYLMDCYAAGNSGSRWKRNPEGDYDFTQAALIPLLYLLGDRPEVLYPETKEHLLRVLLIEEGGDFNGRVPKTYGLVDDTENHVLMTEGSRYLKNQWLNVHEGEEEEKYNNAENGLESRLADYLDKIYTYGIYEFNSDPYIGYTLGALLNLASFATGRVQEKATKILDLMNWQYALGSYGLRRFPPFRRQYARAGRSALGTDYHTAAVKMWLSFYSDSLDLAIDRGAHIASWAAILPYRPADKAVDWILEKQHPYFVKIGHGYNASPEIYTAHPKYMLSAGGVNRGVRSLIVARPIVLFLDDSAAELKGTFHLHGPGEDFMQWNNTGVFHNFAVAAGPVHIPAAYDPVREEGSWSVFRLDSGLFLLTYSTAHIGFMYVHHGANATETLDLIVHSNPDPEILRTRFAGPHGATIDYELDAAPDKWVISAVDGNAVDREFDYWPHFSGEF